MTLNHILFLNKKKEHMIYVSIFIQEKHLNTPSLRIIMVNNSFSLSLIVDSLIIYNRVIRYIVYFYY